MHFDIGLKMLPICITPTIKFLLSHIALGQAGVVEWSGFNSEPETEKVGCLVYTGQGG